MRLFEMFQASNIKELETYIHSATGAFIELEMIHPKTIHLLYIERGNEAGSGGHALKMLINYADQQRLEIVLTVLHNSPKLVRYYEKWGFVMEDFNDREEFEKWFVDFEKRWTIDNDEEDIVMLRLPKK